MSRQSHPIGLDARPYFSAPTTTVPFEERIAWSQQTRGIRGITPQDRVTHVFEIVPRTARSPFALDGGQRYTSWYRLSGDSVTVVTNPWPFTGNPDYQPRPNTLRGDAFDLSWTNVVAEPAPRPQPKPLAPRRQCSECRRWLTGGPRQITCSGACRKHRCERFKQEAA